MADIDTTTSDPATPPISGGSGVLQRRSMLKGLAIAGVAVPFLAACGSSSGSNDSSSSSDPSSGGSSDVLTPISAVAVGGGVILPSVHTVVTQPTKGTFEGFSSTCTHMGCTVATIENGKIICPCHHSMYSVKDGSVLSGPAPRPLPKIAVKVDGNNIVSA